MCVQRVPNLGPFDAAFGTLYTHARQGCQQNRQHISFASRSHSSSLLSCAFIFSSIITISQIAIYDQSLIR